MRNKKQIYTIIYQVLTFGSLGFYIFFKNNHNTLDIDLIDQPKTSICVQNTADNLNSKQNSSHEHNHSYEHNHNHEQKLPKFNWTYSFRSKGPIFNHGSQLPTIKLTQIAKSTPICFQNWSLGVNTNFSQTVYTKQNQPFFKVGVRNEIYIVSPKKNLNLQEFKTSLIFYTDQQVSTNFQNNYDCYVQFQPMPTTNFPFTWKVTANFKKNALGFEVKTKSQTNNFASITQCQKETNFNSWLEFKQLLNAFVVLQNNCNAIVKAPYPFATINGVPSNASTSEQTTTTNSILNTIRTNETVTLTYRSRGSLSIIQRNAARTDVCTRMRNNPIQISSIAPSRNSSFWKPVPRKQNQLLSIQTPACPTLGSFYTNILTKKYAQKQSPLNQKKQRALNTQLHNLNNYGKDHTSIINLITDFNHKENQSGINNKYKNMPNCVAATIQWYKDQPIVINVDQENSPIVINVDQQYELVEKKMAWGARWGYMIKSDYKYASDTINKTLLGKWFNKINQEKLQKEQQQVESQKAQAAELERISKIAKTLQICGALIIAPYVFCTTLKIFNSNAPDVPDWWPSSAIGTTCLGVGAMVTPTAKATQEIVPVTQQNLIGLASKAVNAGFNWFGNWLGNKWENFVREHSFLLVSVGGGVSVYLVVKKVAPLAIQVAPLAKGFVFKVAELSWYISTDLAKGFGSCMKDIYLQIPEIFLNPPNLQIENLEKFTLDNGWKNTDGDEWHYKVSFNPPFNPKPFNPNAPEILKNLNVKKFPTVGNKYGYKNKFKPNLTNYKTLFMKKTFAFYPYLK